MSLRDPKLLLMDMQDALDRALKYVKGMSFEEFQRGIKTQDAVLRNPISLLKTT